MEYALKGKQGDEIIELLIGRMNSAYKEEYQ